MWNDTDIPLAVFFTFCCYGTWLHGDERGSVDRHNNIYGAPRIPANEDWNAYNQDKLDCPPVFLDDPMRRSTELGIRGLCKRRSFTISAINVRTNHVHAVISIGAKDPERVLAAIKASATKRLRKDGVWTIDNSPWAEKGSRRNLWNERSVVEACDYVINRQGKNLTDYDWW